MFLGLSPLSAAWLLSLAVFVLVAMYVEKKKAMRGTDRKPLPKWVDKSIRAFFLFAIFGGPFITFLPWLFTPLFLMYLPTYLDGTEYTGARYATAFGRWVRNWACWRAMKRYFSLQLVVEERLSSEKQYVMGIHPHGIIPMGTMVALLTDQCDAPRELGTTRLRGLAASFVFYVPLYRDMALGGGMVDAARYNAVSLLKRGYSIALVPGGATEALHSEPGRHVVYLRKRSGFIRLALENGADLVPVYTYGEIDVYRTVPYVDERGSHAGTVPTLAAQSLSPVSQSASLSPDALEDPTAALRPSATDASKGADASKDTDASKGVWSCMDGSAAPRVKFWVRAVNAARRKFQSIFGISLPIVRHIIPNRVPITVVVGQPIPVEKNPNPTAEEVQALLRKYEAALVALFDRHSGEYVRNPSSRKLVVL